MKCMRSEIICSHRVLLWGGGDGCRVTCSCCGVSHSPRVIEHHSGQVFTGLGQVGHRQAEWGEQAALRRKRKTVRLSASVENTNSCRVTCRTKSHLTFLPQPGCFLRMVEAEHVRPAEQNDCTWKMKTLIYSDSQIKLLQTQKEFLVFIPHPGWAVTARSPEPR